jgi:hypothetical protein
MADSSLGSSQYINWNNSKYQSNEDSDINMNKKIEIDFTQFESWEDACDAMDAENAEKANKELKESKKAIADAESSFM